jgi:hypothetical protein
MPCCSIWTAAFEALAGFESKVEYAVCTAEAYLHAVLERVAALDGGRHGVSTFRHARIRT